MALRALPHRGCGACVRAEPIDGPYAEISDLDGLRESARRARVLGFQGKWVIHPGQIEVVNAVFTPSAEELAESKELLAAFEENRKAGKMTFSFKGQMVDVPHLTRARTIVERAQLAGLV